MKVVKGAGRLEQIIAMRDEQRERYAAGRSVVPGRELPWEDNAMGRQKWYMHPAMTENALTSLLFWVQEIEPGGRSGRLHYQGGTAGYVWRGRGYTMIDDVRHDWKKGDVLNFPVRTDGITVQHVNLDEEEPAALIQVEPDHLAALGVDRGCGFTLIDVEERKAPAHEAASADERPTSHSHPHRHPHR